MMDVDAFLDAVKTLLVAGIPELAAGGVTVYHHGENDPDEDIKAGIARCKGVSVLVYDLGGENSETDAGEPIIGAECAVELYVDVSKRNRRKTPTLRLAGAIRDDIMVTLHRAPELNSARHCHGSAVVRGYKPLADPDYVAWRITISRSIFLDA